MVCWIYPVVYMPDPIARDRMVIALVGVSDEGERRHAIATNWDAIRVFGGDDLADDDRFEDLKGVYLHQIESIATLDAEKLQHYQKKHWYPASIQIADPAISIAAFDWSFDVFKKRLLRF